MGNISKYSDQFMSMLVEYAPKLIFATIILIVGLWLIKLVVVIASKGFEKRKFDRSLNSFLSSIISLGLKILLIITAAGMVGIQTTSVIALLGAAGLAIGLALQGSLANFAGGVLILIFKPFKVGDTLVVCPFKVGANLLFCPLALILVSKILLSVPLKLVLVLCVPLKLWQILLSVPSKLVLIFLSVSLQL